MIEMYRQKGKIEKVVEITDASKIRSLGYSYITHFKNGMVGYSTYNPLKTISPKKEPKEYDTKYRLDLNMYECRKKLFGFIPYYEYSIWADGKTKTKYRLFRMRVNYASYFTFKPLPIPKVGRSEFESVYKSNKWMIPVNYELDSSKP